MNLIVRRRQIVNKNESSSTCQERQIKRQQAIERGEENKRELLRNEINQCSPPSIYFDRMLGDVRQRTNVWQRRTSRWHQSDYSSWFEMNAIRETRVEHVSTFQKTLFLPDSVVTYLSFSPLFEILFQSQTFAMLLLSTIAYLTCIIYTLNYSKKEVF